MQFGKTLVGALIGAAVGVGLLVAAYLVFKQQGMWLAIVVALATGLGVKAAVSTSGHPSIARGAITLVLALLAYLGGWWLVAGLAKGQAMVAAKQAAPASAEEKGEESPEAPSEEVAEPTPLVAAEPIPGGRGGDGAAARKVAAPGASPLDFVWLAIAALVAYELGRGTGGKSAVTAEGALVGECGLVNEIHLEEPEKHSPETGKPSS